jgi:hypothetical protein
MARRYGAERRKAAWYLSSHHRSDTQTLKLPARVGCAVDVSVIGFVAANLIHLFISRLRSGIGSDQRLDVVGGENSAECWLRVGRVSAKSPTSRKEREKWGTRLQVYGYAVMPEHVHLLLSEPHRDTSSDGTAPLKPKGGLNGPPATSQVLLAKNRDYTHNHRTTAKAFSSEERFTLYWKEIGIGVAALSVSIPT